MRGNRSIRRFFCIALSLLLGLATILTPTYALAEPAAADLQEGQAGGVVDDPEHGVEGIEWTLSKDGVLKISSEGKDQGLSFVREESPWYPYCLQVKKIVIGRGITALGSRLFEGYTSMESLELCEGVLDIGSLCFADCISLSEVTLPESLQDIGSEAFKNCTWLETIELPKQMRTIGSYGFYGCDQLKTVRFPETLGKMDTGAFEGCTALKAIRVPDGITVLGNSVFSNCISLEEVVFPETLAKIGPYTFNNAKSLTSVHFPASVRQIESAFYACEKLCTLYFDGNAPEIDQSAFVKTNATAFYPSDDATWTRVKLQHLNREIQWVPWDPATGETGAILISDSDVTLASDQIPYDIYHNTELQYPEVSVVCEGKKLVPGKDYVLSVLNGGGAALACYLGNYQLQIVGQGDYCGTVKKSYEIVKAEPRLQFASPYVEKQTDSGPFTNDLTVNEGWYTSYTSSDPGIASVDSYGRVTIHAAGAVDITVNTSENDYYKAGSATYRLSISEPPMPTPTAPPEPTTLPTTVPTPRRTAPPTTVPPPRPTVSPPKTPTPTPTAPPEPTVSPTKTPLPTPTPTPAPSETTIPSEPPKVSKPSKATEKTSGKSDSAPSSGTQKRDRLPKPRIVLRKGKSKTGTHYIKIKVTRYKGKYVQIFLRQKNKKYKRIKLASSVIKRKKSFKLAYTHRGVTLWFKVRTYSKRGGKRSYSPYSREKRVVL